MKEIKITVEDSLASKLEGVADYKELIPKLLEMLLDNKSISKYLSLERAELKEQIRALEEKLKVSENSSTCVGLISVIKEQSKSLETIALKALEVRPISVQHPEVTPSVKGTVEEPVKVGLASVKELPKVEKAQIQKDSESEDEDDFFGDFDEIEDEPDDGPLFNGSDMKSVIALNREMSGGEVG